MADAVVNIGGRGNFISLKRVTIALCPEICLLTASAARLSLWGVGEPGDDGDDDGEPSGQSMTLRCGLGRSLGLYRRISNLTSCWYGDSTLRCKNEETRGWCAH